jgi:hypothetical protein
MKITLLIVPVIGVLLGAIPSAFAQQPHIGQSFVIQASSPKDSQIDPLPGHENEYVVPILLPRSDGAVYSGVLNVSAITYGSAVNDVGVEAWNIVGNNTINSVLYNGTSFNVTDTPRASDPSSHSIFSMVPFSGNALLLHGSSPFFTEYTVNGIVKGNTQAHISARMYQRP